jgi:hypothetical protein
VDRNGGEFSEDRIFVTELPKEARFAGIESFDEDSLPSLWSTAPTQGFTYLLLPHSGPLRLQYAEGALLWPGLINHPIVGLVTGFSLASAKSPDDAIFHGRFGLLPPDHALALFASLPPGRAAKVKQIPLWTPDDGDEIVFTQSNEVEITECLVNGEKRGFADYILTQNLPRTVFCYEPPLVSHYKGIYTCTIIDRVEDGVAYMAYPVFAKTPYRWGKRATDYWQTCHEYASQANPAFCCTCVLNYTGFDLEGRQIEGFFGPAAMGEIAYGLSSYSTVYLEVVDKE